MSISNESIHEIVDDIINDAIAIRNIHLSLYFTENGFGVSYSIMDNENDLNGEKKND